MLEVTCAFIIKENKVLITQNLIESDHPLKWEFPGGKVKQNELPEDCITREIKEELNIEIKIVQSLNSVVHDYGFKKIKLIPFLCRIEKGEIRLKVHKDFKWETFINLNSVDFSEADLALIQINENRKVLKEYIRE